MRYAIHIALMVLLTGVVWWLGPDAPVPDAPAPQPVAAVAVQPQDARAAWGMDVLARLGNAQPTPDLVAFMVAWTYAEDASDGALNRNNAYNTTLCMPGRMTGAINGDGACGVQGYSTWQDGIEATARTLEQDNFAAVRKALLANEADVAQHALWASPWAASHYGYGAAWPEARTQP